MPATIRLDRRGPITYSSALRKNADVITQATHLAAAEELCRVLWDSRETIESLVRRHLRLGDSDSCTVAPCDRWIRGGFNICVPVETRSRGAYNVRISLAHAAKARRSQDWCPDVRIPHLYGFGFSDHRHFTHERQMPFYFRFWSAIRRYLRGLLGYQTLSYYVAHSTSLHLPAAYMLFEYVGLDTGRMLSDTWKEHQGDETKRRTLFRGLARIILSLARVPQPRIGSFRFNADSTVTLTNRPLPCCVAILENGGAPRTIPSDETYSCPEPFITDMLALHDGNFLAQRNAIFGAADCRGQMAANNILVDDDIVGT
ncbi:Aminoglycoside phosphotransferase domain-containing protein [Madurella fahalii]|uniref:Aminoglycoside phosphotransferase domain-containing protein n=1 Tax=Madurella fahalii TaxID=1157608 RepID=A0ABQ0FWK1_9PEZI